MVVLVKRHERRNPRTCHGKIYLPRNINIRDNNPHLNKQGNLFFEYLAHTYTSHAVSGIRRQIKPGKQSVSMARFFKEIISEPEILSRKRYVELYKPDIDWADKDFNQFTSPGSAYINPDLVANDLTSLQESSGLLEAFADKHIAHKDQSGLKDLPTYNEVDSCIDLLEKLYIKYHMLFHAEHLDTLLLKPPYDWKNIFRVPWLPSTE